MNFHVGPLAFEPDKPTPEQLRAAGQEDAASDREWFDAHPGKTERIRPPSIREIMACSPPPGTEVHVILLENGGQARVLVEPGKPDEKDG